MLRPLPRWVRQRTPPNVRDSLRRAKLHRARSAGAPAAADPVKIREVGTALLSTPMEGVFHTAINGYKTNSVFVVYVEGRGSDRASFVFKDVNLADEAYPAIKGFPGDVGLPESSLYASANEEIRSFMPSLYALEEIAPDTHFHYYLQDLSADYRTGFDEADDLRATDSILAVSSALTSWMANGYHVNLIQYDRTFPEAFLEYSKDALTRFFERTGDQSTNVLLGSWGHIAEAYQENTPSSADAAVHGDFRRGNVFHHRRDPSVVKLVDWEFAGHGWIHNDLASTLKLSSWNAIEEVLGRISGRDQSRSFEEHKRLFLRCRLERGLLDASLVANQRLALSGSPSMSSGHAMLVLDSLARLK